MTIEELIRRLAASRKAAEAMEAELAAAYEPVIAGIGRRAARAFRGQVTLLAAAPDWEPPPKPGELVDREAAARSAHRRAGPVQKRALEVVIRDTLEALGVSFAVAAPLADKLLASLAARAESVAEGIGPIVSEVVREAHLAGLSVPDTATQIRARVNALKGYQALLLARSDLVAIANGGNLAVVQVAKDAGVPIEHKVWYTALDERVRPTHQAAHGQTVPIDQPFAVGIGSLMYPGDPGGPPEEVWNCRCTLLFGEQSVQASGEPPAAAIPAQSQPDGSSFRFEFAGLPGAGGGEVSEALISALETLARNQVAATAALEALGARQDAAQAEGDGQLAELAALVAANARATEALLARFAEQGDPNVIVNVPEQPAPVVNVEVPVPSVQVAVEQPPRVKEVEIERDAAGRVLGYTIEEFDADEASPAERED